MAREPGAAKLPEGLTPPRNAGPLKLRLAPPLNPPWKEGAACPPNPPACPPPKPPPCAPPCWAHTGKALTAKASPKMAKRFMRVFYARFYFPERRDRTVTRQAGLLLALLEARREFPRQNPISADPAKETGASRNAAGPAGRPRHPAYPAAPDRVCRTQAAPRRPGGIAFWDGEQPCKAGLLASRFRRSDSGDQCKRKATLIMICTGTGWP